MGWIEFLAQYLALVLGSITASVILAFLGYLTIKRMIDKAMQSQEIKEVKKTLTELQEIGEKLIKKIEKMLNPEGEPQKREGYQA